MRNDLRIIRREFRIKLLCILGLFAGCLTVLLAVDNMLVSFLLAFVINYLLNPTISRLERAHLSRTTAILIVFGAIGAVLTVSISLLTPLVVEQFNELSQNLPKYIEGITKLLSDTESRIHIFAGPVLKENLSERAGLLLQTWATASLGFLPAIASKVFTNLLLGPFFAFFMLRDGRGISKQMLSLVPNNLFEMTLNLMHQINEQMGGFIRARLLESAIVGAVVWLGLAIMGFPYAAFLAAFAGIANLIPYIGPFIGALPAFVLALINNDPSSVMLMLGGVYLVSQLIDMLFIIPLVVARIVNLHPVTVIIVIIIGAQVLGVLGMIISIPVASVIKLTANAIYTQMIGFRV